MFEIMPEKQKPQINISWSSTGRMWLIAGCAFLCVFQSSLNDGGRSFVIAVTSFIAAVASEAFLTYRKHRFEKIKDGSAAAAAMIITILMPNLINPIYAAFAAAFAIIVVKYSFGGLGSNWLNPALGGWLFVRFSWSAAYLKAVEESSRSITEMTITSSTSLIDDSVTSLFNNTIFKVLGVQMPSGYIDLLFSTDPGIITDKGLFALLLGTVVITAFKINRGWVPLVFLAVYGFLIRLAGNIDGFFGAGDLLYGLFSGGTMAVAFILAAEPASSARSKMGILFTVVLSAIFSWFFRYRCMEYSGALFALAVVNCLTPLIRLMEEKIILFRRRHDILPENVS